MNDGLKVTVAITGGYLLGRTRKAKLAIALGSWLLGKRLDLKPQALAREAFDQMGRSPEVAKLAGNVRGELLSAGRAAAMSAMSTRLDRAADSLRDRTDRIEQDLGAGGAGERDGAAADRRSTGERPRRRPAEAGGGARKTTAKKTAPDRAAGKKAAPRKATGKQAPGRSATKKAASGRSAGTKAAPRKATGRPTASGGTKRTAAKRVPSKRAPSAREGRRRHG